MTDTIDCYAAFEAKGQLKPWSYTPRALKSYEVNIKIHCCGICGSDLHQLDNGWKGTTYPICPGHEIIGDVIQVGDAVKSLKVGDRVGVGAQRDSCGACNYCKASEEHLCEAMVGTYNSKYNDDTPTYGGYAKYIRVNEKFSFKIPDNLPSDAVAPLLCAGATTFSPLKHHGVTKGTKLGVVGIGGLGHLGVKFGVALGAEVTAISGTESKAAEAKKLGAHHFLASSNQTAFKAAEKSLDVILCTANGDNMDFSQYFKLLTSNGKFIMVGAPENPITIDVLPMLWRQISFTGSLIGSPATIQEMIKLASEHNIVADVQTFPIEQVNEALQGVRDGKPHFRYVLKITQ